MISNLQFRFRHLLSEFSRAFQQIFNPHSAFRNLQSNVRWHAHLYGLATQIHELPGLGIKVATCQAIALARRYGWVVVVGEEDISCPLTAVVFGFRQASEFYLKGQACAGMYTETEEAGMQSEAQVEKFSFGEYEYILAAPLHRTNFDPQVIIIYANPAQILRQSQQRCGNPADV